MVGFGLITLILIVVGVVLLVVVLGIAYLLYQRKS